MAYSKQSWVDHVEDSVTGEVIVEGTPVDKLHLEHIEDGVAEAHAKVDNAMTQLDKRTTTATHTKLGILHKLAVDELATEGLQQVAFVAAASYTEGDTWGVNGVAYTAEIAGEEGALPELLFVAGNLVSLTLDPVGKKLGFKSGAAKGTPPEHMLYFNCMPSRKSIRLAWTMPVDAEGVMIRRKTTPWVSGDDETVGTLVIDAKSNMDGVNLWHEDAASLVQGQQYHYKAMPYRRKAYNVVISYNETTCNAGGLQQEYTFDSVEGTTVYDTSGNNSHATAKNVTYVNGQAGVAAKGNVATKAKVVIPRINQESETVMLWFNIDQFVSALIYEDDGSSYGASGGVANLSIGPPNNIMLTPRGASSYSLRVSQTIGKHFATLKFTGLDTTSILDTQKYTARGQNNLAYTGGSGLFCVNNNTSDEKSFFEGWIDQFRRFGRELDDYEIANLYNNGKGC